MVKQQPESSSAQMIDLRSTPVFVETFPYAMPDTTIVSAPGKVLLTGGYLVLDPAYSGLVIATSSRFYSIVRTQPSAAADTKSAPKIVVKALQFNDAVWKYSAEQRQDASIMVQPIESNNGRNKFVEIALQKTISLVRTMKAETGSPDIFEGISQLDIVIVGDNDFYSQRRTVSGSVFSFTSELNGPHCS